MSTHQDLLLYELILIGNELLIGKIHDTNGQWVIHELIKHGVKCQRITIIPDDKEIISEEIKAAINRKPDFIITSGGLGPTFDDMTLESVALGLPGSPSLELVEEALEMIKDRYKKFYPEIPAEKRLTPARKKMAELPKGSIPLSNRAGTAPGVKIPPTMTNNKTLIYCLPGVPKEFKVIFKDHIFPEIIKKVPTSTFLECGFLFEDLGESQFTELIYDIKDDYPEIWIKTHPKSRERSLVELHLTSFSQNPSAPEKMQELYNRLKEHVINSGGNIIKEKLLSNININNIKN